MIKINKKTGDISYTENDTFKMIAYQKYENTFDASSKLRFIIAKTEESEYIIDKTFDINDDLTFTLTLNDKEKAKLKLGDYKYKMVLLKNNKIVTQISGHFEVKWGA